MTLHVDSGIRFMRIFAGASWRAGSSNDSGVIEQESRVVARKSRDDRYLVPLNGEVIAL